MLKLQSLQARLSSKPWHMLINFILTTDQETGILLLGISWNAKMFQICSLTLSKEYMM